MPKVSKLRKSTKFCLVLKQNHWARIVINVLEVAPFRKRFGKNELASNLFVLQFSCKSTDEFGHYEGRKRTINYSKLSLSKRI